MRCERYRLAMYVDSNTVSVTTQASHPPSIHHCPYCSPIRAEAGVCPVDGGRRTYWYMYSPYLLTHKSFSLFLSLLLCYPIILGISLTVRTVAVSARWHKHRCWFKSGMPSDIFPLFNRHFNHPSIYRLFHSQA